MHIELLTVFNSLTMRMSYPCMTINNNPPHQCRGSHHEPSVTRRPASEEVLSKAQVYPRSSRWQLTAVGAKCRGDFQCQPAWPEFPPHLKLTQKVRKPPCSLSMIRKLLGPLLLRAQHGLPFPRRGLTVLQILWMVKSSDHPGSLP